MSAEIIPISSRTIGEQTLPTVNLRELHAKLESKQPFSDWVKVRLDQSMSTEGSDYLTQEILMQSKPGQRGAKRVINYYATLDTAKHVAMLERSAKGKEFRTYFIEAEKALRAMSAVVPARSLGPVEFARLLLAHAQRAEASGQVMKMLVPLNVYGGIAANGRARLGMRRASFVASRHRKDAAEEFMQTMDRIDEMERQQLELDFEEVASA